MEQQIVLFGTVSYLKYNFIIIAYILFRTIIKGAPVNQAILQHCFFWFGNTAADAAITILLLTLKRFSCNEAVDWCTKRFCCESVLQKR
jgi:hypothetical protein